MAVSRKYALWGTTAERPAYGVVGRCYWNTTDLQWQRDTGTDWVAAGGGGLPALFLDTNNA
jgi:hypothetical protein